jgi:hypothetical protein
VAVLARCVLATVLAAAAALKVADPRSTRAALGTYGIPAVARLPVWIGIVAAELGLALGVALGSAPAAYGAAGLLMAFALASLLALRAGRRGEPCGCFGARSRIGRRVVVRDLALATAFAALPFLRGPELTTEQWLAAGLAVALCGLVALTVAVLALAREIGLLRLQLAPQRALELHDEGPPQGTRVELIDRFERRPRARLALAVFTSRHCRVCRALAPSLEVLGRDPAVALREFDEDGDADAWRELGIPGSPFAVALALDGTVLAKGTFNNLGQLESVVATAERRARLPVGA